MESVQELLVRYTLDKLVLKFQKFSSRVDYGSALASSITTASLFASVLCLEVFPFLARRSMRADSTRGSRVMNKFR